MGIKSDLYVTRKFNCSTSELFRWIVDPERICKWFGPKNMDVRNVETDLTIGGKYSIELLKPNGENFFIQGEYLEIEESSRLVFSFKYQGILNAPPDSIVKITLEPENDSTILSLVQTFETMPSDMVNRTKAWENMFRALNEKITTANKV